MEPKTARFCAALPEISALSDMVLSLREAALGADWDSAAAVSADISGAGSHAMAIGHLANQTLAATYSYLFLISGAFIAAAALVILFLRKSIARSQMREEEGSAFSRALLLAQEKERRRISMELHDTVAQDLSYLAMQIDKIAGAKENSELEQARTEAAALQSSLSQRVRDICSNLAPPDFGSQGLPEALRQLCLDVASRSGLDCRADIAESAGLDFLDSEKQLQLYRISQEALANAQKHSGATQASIKLRPGADGSLSVSISDNGAGIKPIPQKRFPARLLAASGANGSASSGANREAQLGIHGMKERAKLLGGSLIVDSQPGKGTTIRALIPPPPPPPPPNQAHAVLPPKIMQVKPTATQQACC